MLWLLLLALLLPTLAHANDYYTHGSYPAPGSPATSAGMRAELDLITVGFDKLPDLTGQANKIVVVNPSGDGLTTVTGTITTLSGTISQFNTACSDCDFLTLAGTETMTSKTFNLANNTLTGTISQFNTALSDGDLASLAGTETLSNKTLTTLVVSSAGPHAIGGVVNTANQLRMLGTFAPGAGNYGAALEVRTVLTGTANDDEFGVVVTPTLNEAASGTHNWFSSMLVTAPTIGAGAGSVSKAASLRVSGSPTAAATNYALYVDNGIVKSDGGRIDLGVVGAGGSNPNIHLHDGTNDHYFEVNSGNFSIFTPGDVRFSPGSGEKVRISDGGNLFVGTTDETDTVNSGNIKLAKGIYFTEIADPAAPNANGAVLYIRDDGGGNSQLMVKFATGSPQIVSCPP